MSRIRTVVVALALSLFSAAIVIGLVVALAGSIPPAIPAVNTASASSGESAARAASADGVAGAKPTAHERPATAPPDTQPPTGTPEDAPGGDDGGGTADGGGIIPPLPPITPPPVGAVAEITWLGATPYPATCGGSFTIFADVWDDVGVVSAIAYMQGVGYPMTTNTGTNWYVVVPVPAGAEVVGGVAFSVDIRDGNGMGMSSSSQVNVTC